MWVLCLLQGAQDCGPGQVIGMEGGRFLLCPPLNPPRHEAPTLSPYPPHTRPAGTLRCAPSGPATPPNFHTFPTPLAPHPTCRHSSLLPLWPPHFPHVHTPQHIRRHSSLCPLWARYGVKFPDGVTPVGCPRAYLDNLSRTHPDEVDSHPHKPMSMEEQAAYK